MQKERILVVDDEPSWHYTVELMLERKYDLAFAADPETAFTLVREHRFSLAILDQRIAPGLSGIELLARLREVQPDLQAIILTGYAEVEDAEESMLKGAVGYISKGNRNLAEALRARVDGALAAHQNPIAALVRKGESDDLEFKSSARWDMRLERVNKDVEAVIVKTVAAFLNSLTGGVLLIGVGDDGSVVGLEHDYQTLGRRDRDGFESFLVKLLTDACGKDVSTFLHIDFHQLDGNDVCRVAVKPSAHPVYVEDEKFYLRSGNTTLKLTTRETIEYFKTRWK